MGSMLMLIIDPEMKRSRLNRHQLINKNPTTTTTEFNPGVLKWRLNVFLFKYI